MRRIAACRTRVIGVLVCVAAVVLASTACSSSTASSPPAASSSAPGVASGAGTAGGSSSTPPTAQFTVNVVTTGFFLSKAAYYVAVGKGFFAQEGIKIGDTSTVGGDPTATAAVLSGSSNFAIGVTMGGAVIPVALKGQPVKVVAGLAQRSNTACVIRPDVLAKLNLPAGASWQEKAKALKGLTVGVTSVGGGIYQSLKLMLGQAGLNADSDIKTVAVGSDPVAWLAAVPEQASRRRVLGSSDS